MQSVEWGEYKLEDLFEKVKTKKLNYKASQLPNFATENYDLPALTAGIQNQGLNNYVPKENATILKNVISISANGANTGATFYQSRDFTVLQDAYAIKWKYTNDFVTDRQYLFLTSCISKTIFGNYEWTNKAGWEKVKLNKIFFPTKDGKIDFAFMEKFIAELEARRIAELEAYLLATGLKDYKLTPSEEIALNSLNPSSCGGGGGREKAPQQTKINWSKYKLSDLFKIRSSKHIYHANELNKIYETQIRGSLPYVVRSTQNNGIRGYIAEDKNFANEKNTLSFAQDTFSVFYQKTEYFTGNKVKVLVPLFENKSESSMKFITTCFQQFLSSFTWGTGSTVDTIASTPIWLPTKNGKIDFSFMETLISAIQKIIIKEVVIYTNKKILATKRVANEV